jgi:hypothetical protein
VTRIEFGSTWANGYLSAATSEEYFSRLALAADAKQKKAATKMTNDECLMRKE